MTPPDAFQEAATAQQRGDFRAAEETYRKMLQADPRNACTWIALGSLCADQKRLAEAAGYFQQAAELAPREVQGHLHLANVLLRLEKHSDAEAAYRRCLEIQSGHVEAMVNLGYVLGEQNRLEEAIACYERARGLAPGVPEIHHNLGNVLRETARVDEALASYNEALRLRPEYAKAHVNRGIALATRGQVDEAIVSLRHGVELQPDFAEAHNSLGTALSAQGKLDEAEATYSRAIALNPDYPDAHWNMSLVRLLRGDYQRGWPEYEWRWRCKKKFVHPAHVQPRWEGSSLVGQTILLHAEQGLGDTLHFVRYAPLVKARGGRVILQCQGALIPLLSRTPGIDGFVAWGATPPAFDVWSPLMSLPAVFRTTLDTIPATIPYLFSDPALVEHWHRQLASVSGFRVGIAWQGSRRHAWDRHRSAPLSTFEPLSRIPGVRLLSLQKEAPDEQMKMLADPFSVIGFGELIDRGGAFTDTAAIIQNLDLVISVDTAIAHLAGALGVPVWIPLHRTPDWRWMLERRDSPWYPSARLFRQQSVCDWAPVFEQIEAELTALVARSRAARPLLVEVSAGELLDKLAILNIKAERITDPDKLRNVQQERDALTAVRANLEASPALAELEGKLREVNDRLWEIEDEIRQHEQRQDFGPTFIKLARSVYVTNDHRAALKREVNALLKSRLVEEKSYECDRRAAEETR